MENIEKKKKGLKTLKINEIPNRKAIYSFVLLFLIEIFLLFYIYFLAPNKANEKGVKSQLFKITDYEGNVCGEGVNLNKPLVYYPALMNVKNFNDFYDAIRFSICLKSCEDSKEKFEKFDAYRTKELFKKICLPNVFELSKRNIIKMSTLTKIYIYQQYFKANILKIFLTGVFYPIIIFLIIILFMLFLTKIVIWSSLLCCYISFFSFALFCLGLRPETYYGYELPNIVNNILLYLGIFTLFSTIVHLFIVLTNLSHFKLLYKIMEKSAKFLVFNPSYLIIIFLSFLIRLIILSIFLFGVIIIYHAKYSKKHVFELFTSSGRYFIMTGGTTQILFILYHSFFCLICLSISSNFDLLITSVSIEIYSYDEKKSEFNIFYTVFRLLKYFGFIITSSVIVPLFFPISVLFRSIYPLLARRENYRDGRFGFIFGTYLKFIEFQKKFVAKYSLIPSIITTKSGKGFFSSGKKAKVRFEKTSKTLLVNWLMCVLVTTGTQIFTISLTLFSFLIRDPNLLFEAVIVISIISLFATFIVAKMIDFSSFSLLSTIISETSRYGKSERFNLKINKIIDF